MYKPFDLKKIKGLYILHHSNIDSNLNFPRNLEGATRWLSLWKLLNSYLKAEGLAAFNRSLKKLQININKNASNWAQNYSRAPQRGSPT